MNLENRDIMESLVEIAKTNGAKSSDVVFSAGKSLSMGAQEGELDNYKVSGSKIAGIRVIKDGKVGISWTEAFDRPSLEATVKKALENSRFGEVNEFETIDNALDEDLVHMGEVEQTAKNEWTPEKKEALALKLESSVKNKDSKVAAVPYSGLSEATVEGYYLNSLGSFCYDFEHYISCYTSALVKDGNKNSMHYHGAVGKHYEDLDWESAVDISYEHAKNWLDAAPIKSGKYDVIFSIDELQSLFGAFGGVFSGKRAKEGKNPLSEKLGKAMADSRLSVYDSPMFKDSLFKTPFDSEGYIGKEIALIENGVMTNMLHNSVTAKYFKTENTFRAARSARGPLGVSGTTTVITTNSEDTKTRDGEYLEVLSMQGLHSGLNFMSGDFSFGASGYLCKDGKRIQPVNGITVAGNFYKMLNGIKSTGDKTFATTGKDFFAPDIKFSALTIAGN